MLMPCRVSPVAARRGKLCEMMDGGVPRCGIPRRPTSSHHLAKHPVPVLFHVTMTKLSYFRSEEGPDGPQRLCSCLCVMSLSPMSFPFANQGIGANSSAPAKVLVDRQHKSRQTAFPGLGQELPVFS